MLPTARTLAYYRNLGYTVDIVEHWNPWSRTRRDLFNCFDLLMIPPRGEGVLVGAQVTSGSGHSARRRKLLASPEALLWVKTGARVLVVSWAQRKKPGKLKSGKKRVGKVWTPRIEELTLLEFQPQPPNKPETP